MFMIKSRTIYLGLTLVVLAVLLGSLLWWHPAKRNDLVQGATAAHPSGGDFTLQSAKGPASLRDYRGKVVVLYFGYTMCPDVCPTTLAMMGAAFRALKPTELAQVQGIFISVDPQRDTLARLSAYTPFFHPKILGITGTPKEVAQVAKLYGAAYHRVPNKESPANYIVDHTSFMYVINREGKLVKILPHGTTAAQLVAELRKVLAYTGG